GGRLSEGQRGAAGQHVDRLSRHRPERREVFDSEAVAEKAAQPSGIHDRTREKVGAGLLALLDHRDGHVAEPLRDVRVLLEQLAEPDRAREAGRTRSDDEDADLDPLVRRVGRLRDVVGRRERRREVRRTAHPRRWRTSSVSFGTISWTSPTTPRSLNSKMGALGSLLMATIVPELCIPTLCRMAPELPSATYS